MNYIAISCHSACIAALKQIVCRSARVFPNDQINQAAAFHGMAIEENCRSIWIGKRKAIRVARRLKCAVPAHRQLRQSASEFACELPSSSLYMTYQGVQQQHAVLPCYSIPIRHV